MASRILVSTDIVRWQGVGWPVIISIRLLRHRIVTVISRVPLIVADMLLIYITWAKLNARSSLRDIQQLDKRRSLSDILFRDGTSICSSDFEDL